MACIFGGGVANLFQVHDIAIPRRFRKASSVMPFWLKCITIFLAEQRAAYICN